MPRDDTRMASVSRSVAHVSYSAELLHFSENSADDTVLSRDNIRMAHSPVSTPGGVVHGPY